MYQKILVPVDGSPTAARGLSEAIALARVTGGRLRLVHVIDELSLALGAGYGVTYTADMPAVLREAGAAVLSQAEAQVRAAGVAVDTALHDNFKGRVADIVIEEARRWGADLIVLGTHGRRGIGRMFMGSDAESIVRGSNVPVLLLRAAGEAPAS